VCSSDLIIIAKEVIDLRAIMIIGMRSLTKMSREILKIYDRKKKADGMF
jgi:hypothetical protein